ncbi:MAG: hypothetical protein MI750_10245 [Xanthomonadales bacterium]|nr:hypothetical protein [Xanthomonadales bacterium]
MSMYDLMGSIGAALIVWAYWALQTERLKASTPQYSLVNAVGSALILLSLYFEFNFSAFLIELFWLLISLRGWIKAKRQQSVGHRT